MHSLARFLERVGFHLPFSHDWLAERDALRTERNKLREAHERLEADHRRAKDRLAEINKALWQPPGHFYSPIPSVQDLQERRDAIFRTRAVPEVDFSGDRQLELLDRFQAWYAEQPFTERKTEGNRFYFQNESFSYSDAIVLYCMMRYLHPRRIVEVGSGHSSCAMLDVNEKFLGNNVDLTFIDPYPQRLLSLITEADFARTKIHPEKVQDVDLSVFENLQPHDILFIDSSHVAKTGSDVNHLVFRVLPVLRSGVYIHFHDIFYPFEYPEAWTQEGRSWNEAYLLHAFLAHNQAYEVQFFISYLHHHFRDRIEREFPLFMKSMGGSLWLRKR